MSLRKMARILGVSPAYLSRMVNGKRPWNPEIRQRYEELVSATVPKFGNTFGNTNGHVRYEKLVPRKGFEPPLPLREADFKSAASTIPPPGLARCCGESLYGCRRSPP